LSASYIARNLPFGLLPVVVSSSFLFSFFSLFFFFLPAFPDTLKIQGFGRCRERKAEE